MPNNTKRHWYLISYYYKSGNTVGFGHADISNTKKMMPVPAAKKRALEASGAKSVTILSISYLGLMTEAQRMEDEINV